MKMPDIARTQTHEDYMRELVAAFREMGDSTCRITATLQPLPALSTDVVANRHERRQASSRKHQRAALHGAGDQKRIAVERRSA